MELTTANAPGHEKSKLRRAATGGAAPPIRTSTHERRPHVKSKPHNDAPTALDLGPQAKLTPQLQAYFDKCQDKLGFVPNVLRAYAFDNAKLQAFIDMVDDLMLSDSGITKLEREMIAVAVSAVNHCHYCLTAHGAAVRQRAKDPVMGEMIAQNWRAANLPPRQQAMLEFADKLTRSPATIMEADRARLRAAGFTDRDIWDISATAAFYNMSNRLAAATEMRPNSEYHFMVRNAAKA
jgi:uncharacterized peroxidase-related enzyme